MSVVFDTNTAGFETAVLERSRELPVVVDFWAEWCGPCRQLGPALEAAIERRAGAVELAKVDVDASQDLARSYRVQGIPAVKAFRDREVVAEFTGLIRPPQIEGFLDQIVPSPADELAAAGDEKSLREALELDPGHAAAATGLARLLLGRGENQEARDLLGAVAGDFLADGLIARAELQAEGESPNGELEAALADWDQGRYEPSLETLQELVELESDRDRRDRLRRVMIGIFTELGTDHPLAREHRRRLAASLA